MINLVELLTDPEDSAFDQRCKHGNRVDGHAVYCHNETWPDAPRKCRHTWYYGPDAVGVQDEDCPGYGPNSNTTDGE